jgi:hypothetical protein
MLGYDNQLLKVSVKQGYFPMLHCVNLRRP